MINASGIAAILGSAAQIAPIHVRTKLLARHRTAGNSLNVRAAGNRNRAISVDPLIRHRWMDVNCSRQRSLTANNCACALNSYIFHSYEYSLAISVCQPLLYFIFYSIDI